MHAHSHRSYDADRVAWLVDDRPATAYTRLYVRGMWRHHDKAEFEGAEHTMRVARDRQRAGDAPPTRLTRLLFHVERSQIAGMTTWTVKPRRTEPVARVLYLHGGGYVHPLSSDYWRLVRALAGAPAEVVVPAYPLAPDVTVDDVLPRLAQVYAEAHRARPGLPTVLMGDSAGGALVLSLAARLRDERAAHRPARVVALSPWLDATLGEYEVADLEVTDPMLAESGLRAAGRAWAGAPGPDRAEVSPVHASLRDLPPLEVYVGAHDILRPAVDRLYERAVSDGAELTVHEHTAMFHVWMTRAIPEARRTRRELAELVSHTAEVAAKRE